jgi:hypothetical protein
MSSNDRDDEVPNAMPVSEERRPKRTCPHCGGDDLVKGLKLGAGSCEGRGLIGIWYEDGRTFLGPNLLIEPLRVELCNSCGTLTRLYVKDVERDWH